MRTIHGTLSLLLSGFLSCLVACGGGAEEVKTPAPPPPSTVAPPPPPTVTAEAEPPPAPKPTMAEMQKTALLTAADALNAHDSKKFASVYADDAVIAVAGLNEVAGKDAIGANMQEWFDTFANVKVGFSRVWIRGDVIVLEWVINGTHKGELFGVKGTEAKIGHLGLSVVTFNADGKVKTEHRYGDLGTVMTQVGATKQAARPIPTIPAAPEMFGSKGTPAEDKAVDSAKAVFASMEKKSDADFVGLLADDVEYDGLLHLTTAKGKDEGKKFFQSYTKAFPDLKFTVANGWGIGDYAIVEYTVSGTHKGPIGTIAATKQPVVVHAVDVFKTKDGKVSRAWTYSNSLELMQQIGLFHVPVANAPSNVGNAGGGTKPAAPKPAAPKAPPPKPSAKK